MDALAFGLALLVVGMGGTLLSLWLLSLLVLLLKRLFPYAEEKKVDYAEEKKVDTQGGA